MTRRRRWGLVGILLALWGCRGAPGSCRWQGSEAIPNPTIAPATPSARSRVASASSSDRRNTVILMDWLRMLRHGGRTRVEFRGATLREAAQYKLFALRVLELEGRPKEPAPTGFELVEREEEWVLQELADQRRGGGALIVGKTPNRDLVVQAPHTFFDQGTLDLAVAVFQRARARALVINTVHRGNPAVTGEDELALRSRSQHLDSDLAHAPVSFFQAAHAALLERHPSALTVQLHGFRDEEVAADLVLSASGTGAPIEAAATALTARLAGIRILRYPEQTRRLGGMKNVQAATSRERGTQFLHLELSKRFRDRLLGSAEERDAFAGALADLANTVGEFP